jgi:ferredoxin
MTTATTESAEASPPREGEATGEATQRWMMGKDKVEVGEAEFIDPDGGEYGDDGDEDEDEDEIREEETASAREALAALPASCFTGEEREALTEDGWKEYLKAVKVSAAAG